MQHNIHHSCTNPLLPHTLAFHLPSTPLKTIQQDVAEGEEVTISYLGTTPTTPNDLMLTDLGFVLPGNPNDRVSFSAGDYAC